MNVKERLDQIKKRLEEIKLEAEKPDADMEKLNKETDELITEQGKLEASLQEQENRSNENEQLRSTLLGKIARGMSGTVVKSPFDLKNHTEKRTETEQEKIYRSAFLKNLQGNKLTDIEQRAISSADDSAGAAIPTQTLNRIIERVYQEAPLLKEIELLKVNGNVTFAVEADQTEANIHAENAELTDDGTVLIPVTLTTYEINKYLTISKTIKKMSVDAFETWLVGMIGRRVGRKITGLIINGTGTNEATGVEKANTWDDTNSVTISDSKDLTKKDVLNLIALLPGAYDNNAKWLMSKKTLFSDYRPLQDNSNDSFFVKENGKYYVEGYEVLLDDRVTLHEAYLGDFKMYMGNMPEDVNVEEGRVLRKNAYEYLGSTMFDGKPALGEAFVKIKKGASSVA